MAKAKKSDSTEAPKAKPAAAKAPAPKKTVAAKATPAAAEAKKPAKSHRPAGTPQAPLIDTGLAAQTAAAMVANRGSVAGNASTPSQESSSFKNFKDNLNKPSIAGLGGILGTGTGQKKFSPSFGGKQSGGPGAARNQTFGADVNRAGVPRRTGGG